MEVRQTNVLGGPLECCCIGPGDVGLHTVCVEITDEFLAFSRSRGNDLSTPVPEYGFPGLVAGNRWCLCVTRWMEALEADMAPRVYLGATHISVLEFVDFDDLKAHSLDPRE